MNQAVIGKFIAQKRKEKNLTQEQFAQKWVYPIKLFQNGRISFKCVVISYGAEQWHRKMGRMRMNKSRTEKKT